MIITTQTQSSKLITENLNPFNQIDVEPVTLSWKLDIQTATLTLQIPNYATLLLNSKLQTYNQLST